MNKASLLCIIVVAVFASCATMNPFANYYHDNTGGIDIASSKKVILPIGEPKIVQGIDPKTDYNLMLENAYSLIGYSSFDGPAIENSGAIEVAKQVHASVIIIYSKYKETLNGSIPLVLPDSHNSNTLINGSISGSTGSALFSGTAVTTTTGTRTVEIPYSTQTFNYFISYWIKVKPGILGAFLKDLTPEIRAKIQSNKGALVVDVINGSPAFEADILPGDVMKKIGDIEILNDFTYQQALLKYAGQTVDVILFRNGMEISKSVVMNKNPD